jgi:homoserine dehydrogenase
MIKIGLLGFGNVGRAFVHYLDRTDECRNFAIHGVADITGGRILSDSADARYILETVDGGGTVADCAERGKLLDVPAYLDKLVEAGVRVLVECLPTNPHNGQPALNLILRAMDHRLSIVTVDKGPIVHGFQSLTSIAKSKRIGLAYSGTTGVRPPAEIAGCHVLEIHGILNGTTNHILTAMLNDGLSFKQAVAEARDKGIAEPNPQLDIEGWDTACKLVILANEWMQANVTLPEVVRVGIGNETEKMIADAKATGGAVRLIGRARLVAGQARLSVGPKIIGSQSPLHAISGTSKGAIFATREKGELFAGGFSGRDAIAQIILDDIKKVTNTA